MISQASVSAIEAAQWSPHFIRPVYESYCFAQLPNTLRYLLTGSGPQGLSLAPRTDLYQDYDAVILFFIDAFGWRYFERYADRHPFLRRIVDQGLVLKLTSQFPSTTAAHVTTIHTGLSVGESGIFEWYYYEPFIDALIAPLLFSFAGDKRRNTLQKVHVAPEALYPKQTLYHELAEAGVACYVFQNSVTASSPYTQTVTAGARVLSFTTLPEAIVNLGQLLQAQTQRSYYFLYFDTIDALAHHYGPDAWQVQAEIDIFLEVMERIFHRAVTAAGRRTLFLLTADHGQVALDPATTIYLNHSLPQIREFMRVNRSGQLLVPAGSARDLFLYIKDEDLDEAQDLLRRHLADRADVYRVSDLIAQGFFGTTTPSPAFLGRAGNLVVLPYSGETVWWYEQGRFEMRFLGSHGGLARGEMETLLLALPY